MRYTGLTTREAAAVLTRVGTNEIRETRQGLAAKVLRAFLSPISFMFAAALVLTWIADRRFDFYLILVLAFVNYCIGFWQDWKADRAIESLRRQLVSRTKTYRDGEWTRLESRYLVPGDVVEIANGDVVPADLEILDAANATANEAALTGESLPKEKRPGATAYAGSFIATGIMHATVLATGSRTEFGKTALLVDHEMRRSALETDVIAISRMIALLSLVVMAFITAIFLLRGEPLAEVLLLDVSLLIAGIPISLPTVMTVIIALGVTELSHKGAIVRRLSSLEDLANVDLLLSDKTGTLTQNVLTIQRVIPYGSFAERDVLEFAAFLAFDVERSAIDAMLASAAAIRGIVPRGTVAEVYPADSDRKRSSALVARDGSTMLLSLGAAQVVLPLCDTDAELASRAQSDLNQLAQEGFRALLLAVNRKKKEETHMELAGIIAFADTLRDETPGLIRFIEDEGVSVRMVTGDNRLISHTVAAKLGLTGGVATRTELDAYPWESGDPGLIRSYSVFSEVLPRDKYRLVKLAERSYTVAVTGDGVNDLPALRAANVGFAVANAVDALKAAADIVLLQHGIAVIKDALLEARKIFARLYVYSVYRISESFRVIITIGVLGFLYGSYPLTAVQLILLALMNDIPIISLAFNRVLTPKRPAHVHPKKRLLLSSLFGMVGVANSLLLFFILVRWTNLDIASIQTIYFLKLTVSGHMLIFVAHTKQRWWRFLPSWSVIAATTLTQLGASAMALLGIFMAPVSLTYVLLVWGWAFFWMQVGEAIKGIPEKLEAHLA